MNKILIIEKSSDRRELLQLSLENNFEWIHCDAVADLGKINVADYSMIVCNWDDFGAELRQLQMSASLKQPTIFLTQLNSRYQEFISSADTQCHSVLISDFSVRLIQLCREILQSNGIVNLQLDLSQLKTGITREWTVVGMNLLLRVGRLPTDIYIQLSESKYVRVMKVGDVFTSIEAQKYSQMPIAGIYIRHAEFAVFLEALSSQMNQQSDGGSFETGVLLTVELAHSLRDLAQKLGYSAELEKLTVLTTQACLNVIRSFPALSHYIDHLDFNAKSYLATHSILMGSVSCHLASKMGWTTDDNFKRVIMASLFHDVALESSDLAEIKEIGDFSKRLDEFKQIQIESWKRHATRAGEIVRQFKEVTLDAASLIEQHHERPDGSGYPHQLKAEQISPMSALFILAEEIVDFFIKNPGETSLERFLPHARTQYTAPHFKKILDQL